MNHPIIDREEAVQRFRDLLDPATEARFLRLLGEAKMGKSHLLRRVFPVIAADEQVDCAMLDLRNDQITIVEHLQHLRSTLGADRFPLLNQAYSDWINRPQIQVEGIQAILSLISMRSRSEEADEVRMIPHFTTCFVDDLAAQSPQRIVLIFDAVEQADSGVQQWLMDKFLVQLNRLTHVTVVVAGRSVPEPSGSYHPICHSYELRPVEDEDAYIRYCRAVRAELTEQSIRDFAKAFHYVPGSFAEAVNTFVVGGSGHD